MSVKEPRQLLERIRNHEMDVERDIGNLLELLDMRHTDREVRHEMPIHDVDMHVTCPALFDHLDIGLQVHEIR